MRIPFFALSAACLICAASTLSAQCDVPIIEPPPDAGLLKTLEFGRSAGVSGDFAIVGALVALGSGGSGAHPRAWMPDGGPLGGHPGPVIPPLAPHGVAHLYQQLPGQGWVLLATLQASDGDAFDDFGASVAIDGTLAVVGNPSDDDFGPDSGSVYVYRKQGAAFLLAAKLHALDAGPNERFGASVAVDADRIIVGAPGANGPFGLPNVGAAYVFEPAGLFSWTEVERISDNFGQPGDAAGTAVGISGVQALVGAPGHDSPVFGGGAVYAVERVSPGTWLTTAKLNASDAAPQDGFGASVSVDAGAAAIGAPNKSALCSSCGAAYVFVSPGPGVWFQTAQLAQGAMADELDPSDAFGTAVAIADGIVAVSAPHNEQDGIDSGTVFSFQSGASGYVLTNKVNACEPASADRFGAAVDAEGTVLLAGAPGVGAGAVSRGAAYFASVDVIEVASDTIAIFFSSPDETAAAGLAAATSVVDAQCAEGALYPKIEIEDHFDDDPLFGGHRFAMRGRIWELDLVQFPIPTTFAYGSLDPSSEDEIFRATADDCDGTPELELEYEVLDEDGVSGTRATFVWTGCEAVGTGGAKLGNFEVTLEVFLPQALGHAEFDLSARSLGGPSDWAFWCGQLNMSVVENHEDAGPDDAFYLLTPFGHLVKDPALNLVGNGDNIPPRADALGRPSNQTLGFYDSEGRGLYAAMADAEGNRAKNFQFYGCPGGGGEDPTVNIVSLSYQEEVLPDVPFEAVPSHIGRFRGDWFDLAQLYREWLDDEEGITYLGPVKDRKDVPDFAKRLQMAVVLNAGVINYTGPDLQDGFDGPSADGTDGPTIPWTEDRDTLKPLGPFIGGGGLPTGEPATTTVPERIDQYMEHYDLDRVIVAQFGMHWIDEMCAGIGEYVPSTMFMDNAALMEAKEKEFELEGEGKELKFMVYFFDAMYSKLGTGLDWDALAVRNPAKKVVDLPVPECPLSASEDMKVALIDPSTPEWQANMWDAAEALGILGVDGVYCDNAFPDLREYDFSTTHGHSPGFGKYMTEGFSGMFEAIQDGGAAGNEGADPDFITYTEFFFEGFIPRSDTYGPEQAWTDWMTGDANTTQVPLISTLYHHSTILGPPFVGEFTHDSFNLIEGNHVLHGDVVEREKGRLAANYAMAYGWTSGCPIWCPDPAMADPVKKRFAFDWYAREQAGLLLLPAGFSFEQLSAVCDFGAKLARVRGFPLVEPFLMVGRRLRDFRDFSTTEADVSLMQIHSPYAAKKIGPEVETFPSIVHGVWENLDSGYVGVALANFTTASATASFTFEPAEYGFGGAVSVYSVSKTGETLYAGPFDVPKVISVTLPGQDVLVLRVH